MRSLQDALYNWLSIQVVADSRPDDLAAAETAQLFQDILKEEHDVVVKEIMRDEVMYTIHFLKKGAEQQYQFPVDLIDVMIDQMKEEPEKFKNYNEKTDQD
ncbi:hypothetical protein [Metabacillus arenae]|uniref:Uncharacterized protein n=1 Tax=Metabacillus arenae TaxID=2771434 RepID=A0A926NI26_9BACI|nr:hypothetical protein [Metabacillus arenae]MBD1380938.1 hypothetical protein [Metabacillus arenae]